MTKADETKFISTSNPLQYGTVERMETYFSIEKIRDFVHGRLNPAKVEHLDGGLLPEVKRIIMKIKATMHV